MITNGSRAANKEIQKSIDWLLIFRERPRRRELMDWLRSVLINYVSGYVYAATGAAGIILMDLFERQFLSNRD